MHVSIERLSEALANTPNCAAHLPDYAAAKQRADEATHELGILWEKLDSSMTAPVFSADVDGAAVKELMRARKAAGATGKLKAQIERAGDKALDALANLLDLIESCRAKLSELTGAARDVGQKAVQAKLREIAVIVGCQPHQIEHFGNSIAMFDATARAAEADCFQLRNELGALRAVKDLSGQVVSLIQANNQEQ